MRRYVMVLVTVQLLIPAAASAVTTTVTAPATGTRFLVPSTARPTVHFAGTADIPAVDLKCVSSQAGSGNIGTIPLASGVPVTAGTWSVDAQWPDNSSMCEIFAVAQGTTPTTNTDLNGLSGSKVYPGYVDVSTHAGKAYDYFAAMNGPNGYYDFDSFGDCTIDFGQLVQLHEYDGSIFDCNGYVESADRTSPGTPAPSITIDSRPAYPTYLIGSDGALADVPGWTPLTVALSDDGGSWHLISHEGVFRCASGDAFPPSACTAFAPTGVGLEVDERQSPDGRTLTQALRFVSEDGQAHTMSIVLNQTTNDVRQFFFPGTAGFQDYALNASPSVVAPAVATIRNQLDPPTPESIAKGVGSITYARAPGAEQFWDAGDYFAQKYAAISIPANRAARIEFIYSMNATAAGLDGQVAAAEGSIGGPPAIGVTSATNVSAASYVLTGTVTAPETLTELTVNDQPVVVAPDGSFAAPEALAQGANAFTLKATDELGRATTTPFGVTFTTSAPPPAPLAVRFGKSGKLKIKGRVVTTGLTAACPGTGPSCTIAAAARAGRKNAGKGSATVKAGATAKLKLKLTKPAAKLLKRKHKLRLKLKLTGKRSGAPTTTATKTLALKLSRRP